MNLRALAFLLIFAAFFVLTQSRGGGGGRGGGSRGRGSRTSASGYIQRGNPKWKPNPSQETRTLDWPRITRFIAKLFGTSAMQTVAKTKAKIGYQGAYVPKNQFHPKKQRPAWQPDGSSVTRLQHNTATTSGVAERERSKALLYAAVFYHAGTQVNHLNRFYYSYNVNEMPATDIGRETQTLHEWMEKSALATLDRGKALYEEIQKLPYYAYNFTDWKT